MAQNGPAEPAGRCPLIGEKRKCYSGAVRAAFDPTYMRHRPAARQLRLNSHWTVLVPAAQRMPPGPDRLEALKQAGKLRNEAILEELVGAKVPVEIS